MLHITCYMLHVTCYMLHVTCYMLHVTCYMLHVTCYMLHVSIIFHIEYYVSYNMCYVQVATMKSTKPTKSYVNCYFITLLGKWSLLHHRVMLLHYHAVIPLTGDQYIINCNNISTAFSIRIEFEATEYSHSIRYSIRYWIRYSIRIRNSEDVLVDIPYDLNS